MSHCRVGRVRADPSSPGPDRRGALPSLTRHELRFSSSVFQTYFGIFERFGPVKVWKPDGPIGLPARRGRSPSESSETLGRSDWYAFLGPEITVDPLPSTIARRRYVFARERFAISAGA